MLQRRFHLHGSTKNKPPYLRHFLSRSVSPSHIFPSLLNRFIYFCLFPYLCGLVNISKICISFLSYFLYLFFMSDLFISFSEPPLWLRHHYINIIVLFFFSSLLSFLRALTLPLLPPLFDNNLLKMAAIYKWNIFSSTFPTSLHLLPPTPLPFLYILKKSVLSLGELWGRQVMLQGSLILFSLPPPLSCLPQLVICMYVSVCGISGIRAHTLTQRSSSSFCTWFDLMPQADQLN